MDVAGNLAYLALGAGLVGLVGLVGLLALAMLLAASRRRHGERLDALKEEVETALGMADGLLSDGFLPEPVRRSVLKAVQAYADPEGAAAILGRVSGGAVEQSGGIEAIACVETLENAAPDRAEKVKETLVRLVSGLVAMYGPVWSKAGRPDWRLAAASLDTGTDA